MRTPIVVGNWKMNKTASEAVTLVEEIKKGLAGVSEVEVGVCPPFTALDAVGKVLAGSSICLGGQNMYWEPEGAFTGEVSAEMLLTSGCRYVILGHSERRAYFGETNETVNKRLVTALDAGLSPIVCVGETLDQRESGVTAQVVEDHVSGALAGLSSEAVGKIVLAYEPVWAIGTGLTATPEQAQEVHALIRALLERLYDAPTSAGVRIQYGGSVKPDNAAELFACPDIDGGLIGGAALQADSFVAIIEAAR